MTQSPQALFELAGGEERLRPLLQDFYDRVFDDVMIGFFFKGKDKALLVQLELEFALKMLGADVEYSGRSLPEAHAAHMIMGGQFNRRLVILKETLTDHNMPSEVFEHWIEHTLSLRSQITRNLPGECRPPSAPA
ncbi:MAG: hemoglobin [Candidatus Paceibacteria bacterium]|jgi:hemoglobin